MTAIQWTDETWNPVTGCAKVSAGCKNCYAEGVANRFWGDRKFTDVICHEDRLDAPLHWRKPRRVFVNSMSDLFHDDVPTSFIGRAFAVMALAATQTFQILTKRPERMRDLLSSEVIGPLKGHAEQYAWELTKNVPAREFRLSWPLPNVWLGVSCENQETAEARIPILLQTPAAVRFVSCEPLLGPINLSPFAFDRRAAIRDAMRGPAAMNADQADAVTAYPVDWVIVGGESGPGARPCDVAWIRGIVEQCRSAGVACFVKQLGAKPVARNRWDMSEKVFAGYDALGWSEPDGPMVMRLHDRKGGDPSEWHEDLRIREFPKVAQ